MRVVLSYQRRRDGRVALVGVDGRPVSEMSADEIHDVLWLQSRGWFDEVVAVVDVEGV